MSDTNALSLLPSGRAAGEATRVEMQRAIAEVQGAIIVAQQVPRDETAALEKMIDSCKQVYLAERAFFRYPKGKVFNEETRKWEKNFVTGPSVHLARELARIWGNIQYGVKELRRDDAAGESEMMAYAWDVQTNTRTEMGFIVKHLRDKGGGQEKITDLQDIYTNNANSGARRVRECIYAILPPWLTEKAKIRCTQTNADGGGKPLPERISAMLAWYMTRGVRQEQLERKVGRRVATWTGQDIAILTPVWRSLEAGETTVAEEFPVERVDPADLEQVTVAPAPVIQTSAPVPAPSTAPGEPVDDTPPPAPEGVDMATKGHAANINNLLKRFDYPTGPEGQRRKMGDVSTLAGRAVTTLPQLTAHEANEVITQLGMALETDNPNNALDAVLDAYRTEQKADNQ